jgi:uncharacterized membrane protein (GlpM family)
MELIRKGTVGGRVTAAVVWLSKGGNTLGAAILLAPHRT